MECASCGKTFVIPPVDSVQGARSMKSPAQYCPFCGGELLPGVKKCRHCGEWLNRSRKIRKMLIFSLFSLLAILLITDVVFLLKPDQKVLPAPVIQPPISKPASAVPKAPKGATPSSGKETEPKISSKRMSPSIGVMNFANPAHSATCVLYINDREVMRRETMVGIVIFKRVECNPEDVFSAEMLYRNGYGAVSEIVSSYSRKASDIKGDIIALEPENKFDREKH